MRRGAFLVLLAGVVALGAAALSSGDERPVKTAAKPRAEAKADLPPLPQMRPKVVEPVAGNGVTPSVTRGSSRESVEPGPQIAGNRF